MLKLQEETQEFEKAVMADEQAEGNLKGILSLIMYPFSYIWYKLCKKKKIKED